MGNWDGWTPEAYEALQKRRQLAQDAPQTATALKREPLPRRGFDPFLSLLTAHHLPLPELEYRFLPTRQFKADYCWPVQKIIVERMGGIWSAEGSRAKKAHAMPLKILRDYEKANLAQLAGFRYLQYTPEQLDSGAALETMRILLTD